MFAATGNRVERLHRSHIGGLSLDNLAEGAWRVISPDEVRNALPIGIG
jgi:16S rRNA pseudouridine516 synthase